MSNHVCLIDARWNGHDFQAGDIYNPESKEPPGGDSWASFDPDGLVGTPCLISVAPPELSPPGDRLFVYQLDNGEKFSIRAKLGQAEAKLSHGDLIESAGELGDSVRPSESDKRPPNGTGLEKTGSTAAAYAFCRWNPDGSKSVPPKPREWDVLRGERV
jgi:hypothetical protein